MRLEISQIYYNEYYNSKWESYGVIRSILIFNKQRLAFEELAARLRFLLDQIHPRTKPILLYVYRYTYKGISLLEISEMN